MMMVRKKIRSSLTCINEWLSLAHLSCLGEKPSLLTFLFHGIFQNQEEISLGHVDPQQGITTSQFRQFIDHFSKNGYQFVSPEDILSGLSPRSKYILITFDDGYYNNIHSLPILHEYGAHAVFFISTQHVIQNKSFWWDVVYRMKRNKDTHPAAEALDIHSLKHKRHDQIESQLTKMFGRDALTPVSDIDRPFSPAELAAFSKERYVHLGNHTQNHAILTNYSSEAVKSEIKGAQKDLLTMAGIEPDVISYPNGSYSQGIIEDAKACNMKLGIVVNGKKNTFPIDMTGDESMMLNRFVLWGNRPIDVQCKLFRSDLNLKNSLHNIISSRAC